MSAQNNYWFWDKVFSPAEIKSLVKTINSKYDQVEPKNLEATDVMGKSKKNLNCKQILYSKVADKLDHVVDRAYAINSYHFGFNLFPKNSYDFLNFNIYNSSKQASYNWHCDRVVNSSYDIKLTVLINLSTESYKGGDFSMFMGDEFSIPQFNKPGSMLMFRSFIHHKVSPVTKGERNSLTLFLKGPKFI